MDSAPTAPYEGSVELTPEQPIDRLVLRRLQQAGIKPARLCSDAVFLRRAHLDAIGTLPTADEARQFLASRAPDRRQALVDRLLARDEFADYWALKWADLLRVKSEYPINLWPEAAQAYHRWIRTSIAHNVPYDRFARELLTSSGSNFRSPQSNFYRAVQGRTSAAIAQAVALTFMGCRAEKWPRSRLAGMAAFFSQLGYKATGEWKEEIVLWDPAKAATGSKPAASFPDGKPARIAPGQDPREVFAAWLTSPGNPWFARAAANRVWAWLLGRGIVHEPDDIRPDNPPSHPELLAYLEKELGAGGFDLKRLFRAVLVSGTYQLSSIPRGAGPRAEALFASYPLRRLDAEVLIDALDQITGTTEAYSSTTPEPYTWIPAGQRTVCLADGSITSPFLEMFGRPARDTGLESERSSRPTAQQRLHLLNSSHVQRKIDRSQQMLALTLRSTRASEIVDTLYLTILSRYPTDAERRAAEAYGGSGGSMSRYGAVDLAWALINSAEFLYRH